MKVCCLALCAVLSCSWSASAADLALTEVTSVYLLPMTGGLDQYLANRLSATGRFQVVTDPAKADAIFTDRLGVDFEDKMTQLYPPPPPPEPPKKEVEAEKAGEETDESIVSMFEGAGGGAARSSTFSRGRGNVFLVDRESRLVLWSYFLRPRSTRPEEMDRVAGQIAEKVTGAAKDLEKRQKAAAKAMSAPATVTIEVPPPAAPVVKPVEPVKPVTPAPAAPVQTPPAPPPAPTK
jgi:hypothetical protein